MTITADEPTEAVEVRGGARLSDEHLERLLAATSSCWAHVLPDGTHIANGPLLQDLCAYPGEDIPALVHEVFRLRNLAEHYGVPAELLNRT